MPEESLVICDKCFDNESFQKILEPLGFGCNFIHDTYQFENVRSECIYRFGNLKFTA